MNDTDMMTRLVRNAMEARKEASPEWQLDEFAIYLEGMVHILQVIDPGDLATVLDNLGLETIDDIYGWKET